MVKRFEKESGAGQQECFHKGIAVRRSSKAKRGANYRHLSKLLESGLKEVRIVRKQQEIGRQ